MTAMDGTVVNAVYGVLSVVLKLLKDYAPDAFVVCWDTEAPTFRHEAYKEYKAHRDEQPDELYVQVPLIQEGLRALGIDSLELDGYEADDLLGTLGTNYVERGYQVVIVTGDRDILQLIRPGLSVLLFKKGVSDTHLVNEKVLLEDYKLTPAQFLEYKALRGDPSDNIPGVKGIGEKGATNLLLTHGSIEGMLRAAHDETSAMSASVRAKLLAAEHEIPGLMELVRIHTSAPIAWEAHEMVRQDEVLRAFFHKMGFASLAARVYGGATPKQERPTERITETSAPAATAMPSASITPPKIVWEDVTSEQVDAFLKRISTCAEVWLATRAQEQSSLFEGGALTVFLVDAGSGCGWRLNADAVTGAARTAFCAWLSGVRGKSMDAKHDTTVLHAHGFTHPVWVFDVLLGGYVLAAGERNYDVETVAALFGAGQLVTEASSLEERLAVAVALEAPMRQTLGERTLQGVLDRFELPLIEVLVSMEEVGIKIDRGYLKSLSEMWSSERQTLEKTMCDDVGEVFNPASPSQLAKILFETLKLPTKGIKKGKTGFSTASPELEKLRGMHPIIEQIERHRELSKLLSTYVDVLPTLVDGDERVHTTFQQAVAATGRLSSINPNLQNIPIRTEDGRRIRDAFVAREGCVLLACDYSQIELRLAAALSKDPAMTQAFLQNADIHRATAAKMWDVAEDEVTSEQRRAAKAINFGILYGQGPHGLAQVAGISYAEAKEFIQKYFEVYAGFLEYIESTKALARKLGYVETLFGRRRPVPEIVSKLPAVRAQAERVAVNMPLQGTAADLIKLAMIHLAKSLPEVSAEAKMVLQVHDELVFEVPEADVARVARHVCEVMEGVEKVGVPIVVESKTGKTWGSMVSSLKTSE